MAHSHFDLSHEVTRMRPAGKTLGVVLMAGGGVAVIAALLASLGTAGGVQRFWFAYLFGLCAITAVSCASLIFTLLNHLVRAGWITNVRRIMETMAVQLGLVLILALPILFLAMMRHGTIYSWAKPGDTPVVEHKESGEDTGVSATSVSAGETKGETKQAEHNEPDVKRAAEITYPNEQVRPGVQRDFDENIARKTHFWLNPFVWSIRVFLYLAILSGIAYFYWSSSVKQDATGDLDISDRLFTISAPLVFVSGLTTTFIAFDVFMSLDPHWFSTMYGVYFFASGTQAMWAIISLFVLTLQSRGYIRESVTTEHRHDLGKFLWAFIFFWGYIAFSQYMLQWYANLPEETFFFDKRGYSQAHPNGYTPLVVALLFGRFIIPFLGLISRHVKRNRFGLGFWAVWLLCFFVVDIYLLVLPDYSYTPLFGLPEILGFGGVAALWLGNVVRVLGNHELRAVRDPRVHESLALQNF